MKDPVYLCVCVFVCLSPPSLSLSLPPSSPFPPTPPAPLSLFLFLSVSVFVSHSLLSLLSLSLSLPLTLSYLRLRPRLPFLSLSLSLLLSLPFSSSLLSPPFQQSVGTNISMTRRSRREFHTEASKPRQRRARESKAVLTSARPSHANKRESLTVMAPSATQANAHRDSVGSRTRLGQYGCGKSAKVAQPRRRAPRQAQQSLALLLWAPSCPSRKTSASLVPSSRRSGAHPVLANKKCFLYHTESVQFDVAERRWVFLCVPMRAHKKAAKRAQ